MKTYDIIMLAKFYNTSSLKWHRFNYCQAWVSETIFCSAVDKTFRLIKSYNTVVGFIDLDECVLYELDKWSKTTSKQVSQIHGKFFNTCERKLVKLSHEERAML